MAHSDYAALKEKTTLLLAEWKVRSKFPCQPTGLKYYQPRSTDVIISTFPKSGTTLLQNMVYQIVVASGRGPPHDPDGTQFRDISIECPWLEFGPELGVLEGKTNPRIFKTHSHIYAFNHVLSIPRFLYCIRHVHEIPGSFLDFKFDHLMPAEALDEPSRTAFYHTFVDETFLSQLDKQHKLNWYSHVRGWTETAAPNILFLFFDDVKDDLRGTATRIARFLGLPPLSSQTLDIVEERCSRKWMLGNPRFDTTLVSKAFQFPVLHKVLDLERIGFNKMQLTELQRQGISRKMKEYLGVATFEELILLMKKRHKEISPPNRGSFIEDA